MRAGLVTTTVLLGLLLLAAPASADYRDFRAGVMDSDELYPERDIPRMGTADAEVFRTLFRWARIEVTRRTSGCNAAYNWRYTDRVVSEAGRRGVDVLPFVAGSPEYVPGSSANAPPTGHPSIEDYKCFVRELVQRYGRGGAFPRNDGPARAITEWQVWNEPTLPQFAARGDVSPREYGRLLKVTRSEILRVDPRATIVLAGIPEFSTRGMDAKRFLQRFYRIKGIERKFDALALHPYARDHRGVEGAMIRLQDLLRQVGDRRRSVWITEVGWGSHGRKHFLTKTERGQARQLKKTFRMLRNNRRRFNVGTVAWFRWRDSAPRSANRGPFDYAGLYFQNGKPKRSCRAFADFTGGRCRPIRGLGNVSSAAGASLAGAQAVAPSPEE